MQPPSLRLLVGHPARSVSLQLQHRLNSTENRPHKYADFLAWARKERRERSKPRLRSGNAQSRSPLKKSGVGKAKKPRYGPVAVAIDDNKPRFGPLKVPVGDKKPPSPALKGWSGENWRVDNWGSDKLRPASEDKDLITRVRKPKSLERGSGKPKSRPNERKAGCETEYTRRLEGVLTPLDSPVLQEVAPLTEHRPIATLAHKLDRVLFNPGAHWLQEPRSGVYNFTPWLQNIPDVSDFAFERLPMFVKSSRDEDLRGLAKREKKTFCGSTSSLTGMLAQVYFLISGFRPPDASSLGRPFEHVPSDFTPGQLMPASVVLDCKDGVYAIDSAYDGKNDPEKNVLTWLGTLLEKFLTMAPEEFRRLLRDSPNPAVDSGEAREAYRYAKSRRLVMRSQLDCHDPRLPGTGVFDLKTRAALPVRIDLMNYKQHSTYLIRTLQGRIESFEREYHDLMRSAFLKYSFQARIGNMDGVLVAHHNTARIFGFRYIPLSEMEACMYGGEDRGEAVFEKCVLLLEEILKEVTSEFPDQSVRCLLETRGDKLNVFVEPEVHDGSKGPRSIVHMVVQSTSYVDGRRVRGGQAVAKSGSWKLHWSIVHASLSLEEKEYKLREAMERKWRAYSLPPGVSVEEMEDIWNQLDFGKRKQVKEEPSGEGEKSTFDPSFFSHPGENVRLLRELSMQGKVDMELMLEKAKGRPKLIWGEPEAYIDQAELDGVQSGTEASEVVGEDVKTNEAIVPQFTDYSQQEEVRGRGGVKS